MTAVTNEQMPRVSALVCWPVEFLDYTERNIYQPHVTALYFPDVTDEFLEGGGKADLLEGLSKFQTKFEIAKVIGPDAFGPDKNVPVLRVDINSPYNLINRTIRMRNALDELGMRADRTYQVNPHVTVDLPTLIKPPTQVLLRPLEVWWMDDEPVVV